MTSAGDWISEDLEPATLLSVQEENGVVTKVYVAPCLEPITKVEPLLERKPELFPEANTLLFHCPFCCNGIRTGGAYKVHLMACERRFAWMMKDGPAVPQLQCSICKETFSSVAALISHRLQHSSPSMNRTCGSCHVMFETELEYRTHLESHLIPRESKDESYEGAYTITKLFNCLFCRKEFLACFRPGQVSRRYACDECVQRLKTQEAEKKPKKRKADLCCDRCGRKYKYEGFLNRHLKTCQVPERYKRKRELEIDEAS
ncbi:PR domain zinc finger protein 4 [Drosophila teissieri]|uniref:PR domain zinc finger protein 4 n=1 Tax=Drosophila teissieri TaxID=7243 RepID=UPI001CBA4E00|nr:PR domain zinc finger protein 4 [Drosophila teissieri]